MVKQLFPASNLYMGAAAQKALSSNSAKLVWSSSVVEACNRLVNRCRFR